MYDISYLNNNNNFSTPFNNQMGNMNDNNFNNCYCFKSYFRVFHAIVNAPAVDIYVNEMLLASNLKYGEFSNYIPLMPGNYKVTVHTSGRPSPAIVEAYITINRNTAYTGALAGRLPDVSTISLLMIPEEKEKLPMTRMAAMRFINLNPNSPSLDLVSQDGTILFSDISYKEVTDNVAIPPGIYTLYLKASGTENTVLTVPNIEFVNNMYYSLFSIGIYDGTPNIELLIPEDGLNYLDLC